MESVAREFLEELLKTPSPSGYEERIQAVVQEYVSPFAEEVRKDLHGNLIAVRNREAPLRVMLAGHCDQIGLLVTHINEQGYLYTQPIGGWDPQVLIGQRVTVWHEGNGVPGVISRKAIHLLNDEERKQVVKLKDLWIDIGAKDQTDAETVVTIGDGVTLELRFQELRNDLAASPAMDDKTGLWIVIEAFRRAGDDLQCALYLASTVQEEVGLRGATTASHSINPAIGIAVDVTHATDCPTIDKQQEGDVALGGGPVIYRGPNMNPRVVERLIRVANERDIPYQLAALGRASPTDANAMQVARGGMATGLVSVPNRYMHSPVETVSLADLDRTADLLAGFVQGLEADADLTP